ncbi:hypothetical protein [Marivivens marinus]|uniref:hypothetical protein n=1 Tax=Marivivens marinus TaxID=3110173 RepID=UPI003B847C40
MFKTTLALIALATPALAYVPVLDIDPKTADAPYVIDDAEHSKAIYAILDGDADYYRIEETEEFDFYVGITAAKLEGCDLQNTFSFEVLDANMQVIDSRDGSSFDWWPWFEEFGEQWYWVGPEIGADFASTTRYPAGTYYVRVFNEGNTGKYVLAVGDDERFGLGTLLTIRGTVRETEALFWDEADCP